MIDVVLASNKVHFFLIKITACIFSAKMNSRRYYYLEDTRNNERLSKLQPEQVILSILICIRNVLQRSTFKMVCI